MIRIGINGFGRIGRTLARIILDRPDIELVAVNDPAETDVLSYLLKYDSIHGRFPAPVSYSEQQILAGRFQIAHTRFLHPAQIPWEEHQVDLVVESSGVFKTREELSAHLTAGAKKVIVSAPLSDPSIPMTVLGVNNGPAKEWDIISNASCTTNSAAHMIQLLDEICGIESGYITTVHSYTTDQRLHDTPHKDFRRARAGAVSIVPTTTGAAKALNDIFPHLEGRLGGCGIRVPVPNGSLTDLTCIVKKPLSAREVNMAFKNAAETRWPGLLEYCEDPVVSIDIINNPHSCILDAQLTNVIGNMIKIVGWYDNEWGYSSRLADLIALTEARSD